MLSVLFVDDNPAFLEVFESLSEQSREITMATAESVKEAQKILSQKSFDAIVLDYDMPETNGIEFLKILRSRGDTTPVIMFTGASQEKAAMDALNYGADGYIKKGTDPHPQFRELLIMVEKSVDRKRSLKSSAPMRKVVSEMINFSSDPSFAVGSDGVVLAWNDAMERLTDILASEILGKGDNTYAEPFFGKKKKMLVDLLFDTDDEIKKQKYMLLSRVKRGPVVAVTTGMKPNRENWTLWMKAMPAYDSEGNFMAAIGSVRDITDTISDMPFKNGVIEGEKFPLPVSPAGNTDESRILENILGKSTGYYREGVRLYLEEKNFPAAIAAFDQAIRIDEKLPQAWNDRGLCYREQNDLAEALRSFLRAVELDPENIELLYYLGETLERIGVMYMNTKYLESAVETFKKVVDKMPDNADGWAHIGVCLKDLGRTGESRFYFDRARDIKAANRDTPIVRKRDELL